MRDIRVVRLSEGVEWAVHACTLLAVLPDDRALPAARLADFHGVPPAYLAKHLQALSRAGIAESVPGPRGGYRLARAAQDVPILDVVLAVEGDDAAFRCSEIRRRGPAGQPADRYPRPCGIARVMWSAEDAWRQVLHDTTLADVLAGLAVDVTPEAAVTTAVWIQEASR